eukprot:CAMPEP_0202900886 /NCGR_PEP_ID=MMETSP1392-20130828/12091_1 /ASSEMBLY_ACC=CAM_ASM_000868 /TAXON_ID=225041 /ORGANISM="Chlamydomonas chlamydogama, Strain SAG 11-48b" /LENGTH=388 /DNA_ID=CAMNT_0049587343 /DNA_START=36 /DNA_END=1199 /DNA_ORIENTATION=-
MASSGGGLQELQKHLSEAKLKDLVSEISEGQPQAVITLEHNQSVSDALQTLAKRKVLSAPVVVAPGLEDLERLEPDATGPSLLGWVDVRDVMHGLLSHLKEKHEKLPTNMLLLMTELEKEAKTFSKKLLITLKSQEDRGLVYHTEADASILQTIKGSFLNVLSNGRVIHRVAIFDPHGSILRVVSQLDVVRYLYRKCDQLLGPLASSSVEALGLLADKPPVVTVDPHVPTVLAYDKMLAAGVSAAAVVAAGSGEIIANLSISDLRCIQPQHLGVLALPVAEFLALSHRTSYLGYSQRSSNSKEHPFFAGSPRGFSPRMGSIPPPGGAELRTGMPLVGSPGGLAAVNSDQEEVRLITAQRDSSLKEVLATLVENRVHRVYIVEPLGAGG